MQQTVTVPAGLAEHPPGPQLCTLLAGLDAARVTNHATVELLRAWRRLRSYVDAGELAVLAELGRRDSHADPHTVARVEQPDPDCLFEIATALTVTENSAARDLELAETLVWRLPAVHAALAAGAVDRAKAWVFADYLGDDQLTDACVGRVLDALLPKAPGLTTGQLRARIQRMLIAIDPGAAGRRYRAALRERRVVCYLDRDGAATISMIGLDPAAAQASCERVDILARAVREAGHPDSLSHIRVELYMALTDGTVHTMSNDQIIATLLARAARRDDTDSTGQDGTEKCDDVVPQDRERERAEADRTGRATTDRTNAHGQAGADGRAGADGGNGEDDAPSAPGGSGPQPDAPGSGDSCSVPATTDPPAEAPPERAPAGIEIRIRLSTLLGHDEHPAEIPGLGPLLAGPARDAVARHRHAEWRFAVTDTDGHLLLADHTRQRPVPAPGGRPGPVQSHGGVVELQVPATLLTALVADPPPGWQRLIADLAAQYSRRDHLRAALDEQPHARFPHRALRRHIEIRDRTCRYPGCRRPARKAQQDHTHEHRHGGVTVETNLGALCIVHHSLKTAGHWRLTQPTPGTFRWTSPLRHSYLTRGEPVCPPLPDPVPPGRDDEPAPDSEVEVECAPPSAAERALEEMPIFPEPEPDVTADDTAETAGDMTALDDDAPDRAPPNGPDQDKPPF
ncbi:HNH endonuclease signature motif containing protein [Pseudonocardia parietis]|uniref:DUF222 domain-containing protein n=1 Tax=Pseudonocardia parietis TaxID=570936 RepID=A0ABS4VYZ7_9PSEU|nr:HNH endonuclease signature motif containing protein [Pseudonocardia parietis]MBP2368694.1 hypothetical protein [Pseudonocardia parietis]